VIASPLLARRARSSGGSGGIRVTLERDGEDFVVRSTGARSREFRVASPLTVHRPLPLGAMNCTEVARWSSVNSS